MLSAYSCFAVSFCILAFPLGGFIRNMNILSGDILLIFILYSFSKKSSNEHVFSW